ncbi:MAG: hypothetical protein R3C28_06250 [Pirellulaceae bacterium]
MLWVGWFGFNAGSELASDGLASSAFAVTHFSAAAAALTWALIEWGDSPQNQVFLGNGFRCGCGIGLHNASSGIC